MKKYLEQLSEQNKSVLLSTLFHAILLLLFLLCRSGVDFPDQEFAEIGFVAATTRTRSAPTQPSASAKRETDTADEQTAPAAPPARQEEAAKAPPVNLPTRRMLEEEEPDLTKRQSGKLTPSQDNSRLSPREDVYDSDSMQKEVAARAEGKSFSANASDDAGKESSPASDIGAGTTDQPYTLEGDASRRTILSQILPEYPPGLQREAVVRIRFWVLPDGRIGAMIPVRKGDPTLEEITMKAMRQWRFNALPAGEEQKNVEGIITFVYKLR
ncbi:TonB family protein [candidate division KSB1 bacterium]|nr:TonB family protein [candidate division KSB1 bacterium]